ncbi:MAP kinase-activated protein kinase 2-like [Ostrinia furnacalis]|uniref:MAP kinase-activated protein kinase 2-like n=1 Tax=Ostrinia furnacalis TaxID=93504 RepID=UPI0010399563|nr:MAP kinase-activated protein kinase 2-like [Ostrinia furnacalis]
MDNFQKTPKTTPITEDYHISNTVLGLGINGKVVECKSKSTGARRALKVLHDSAKARREVELHWRASGCIHIVEVCYDLYYNPVELIAYLPGGHDVTPVRIRG